MRLKTLRKERPAFENEGAVINGSRMDISNSEFKPAKYRTNNTFALPTSLNTEVTFLNISPFNHTPEINTNHLQQSIPTARRAFVLSTPFQTARASSYQAIEAAYLEHGIRIHYNPSAIAAATQQQNVSTENLNGRKSANNLQRHQAFVNRNPSRSSSALNYSSTVHDIQQDSRPFSALQQTSTVDFDQVNTHNASNIQGTESQQPSQLTNNYCSSSILASEHSDPMILPTQLTITNGTTSRETLIQNDPDLAYMSTLLQTTTGDSFRDNIRRRAGLRGTFAVHRHPQISTSTNSKLSTKSPLCQSPPENRRSSLLRTPSTSVVPTIFTPSSKKLEKDILKHASRIRTNQIRDSFLRHQTSLRSQLNEHTSIISHSPTRLNSPTKGNKTLKSSKSISLKPLELLLAPSPSSSTRATSLLLHDHPTINHKNYDGTTNTSKKSTKSPKISFAETNNDLTTNFCLNEQINSSLLNDDSLPSMKTSSIDPTTNAKTRQSNSFDSGCYDRSSSSGGDTRSITSLSINQAASSLPSARLTSASTRRSNATKKVSFEDQSSTVTITTATYI